MSFQSNKPKITIVCTHGRNLSRYLKSHLQEKGISSYAVGMFFENQGTVQKIKNAHTVICVHPDIKKAVEAAIDLSEKQVICLDIDETPSGAETAKAITGEVWLEYQREYVYPELERQIKKYLKKLEQL